MVEVSGAEVRAARAFIYAQGLSVVDIPPRKFAMAAKELGVSFKDLLKLIAKHMTTKKK